MNEFIGSEIKSKRKVKHVIVLIIGLLILGFAVYQSLHWQIGPYTCISTGEDQYNNYFSSFILKFLGIRSIYAQIIMPGGCGTEFARNHYLDLYLISLVMIGYGVRGLIKKN